MTPYTHGGDVLTARARFGGDVLDCSANLHPLGMPPAVQAAAAAGSASGAWALAGLGSVIVSPATLV